MAVAGGLLKKKTAEPKLKDAFVKTAAGIYSVERAGTRLAKQVEATHKPQDGWAVIELEAGFEHADLTAVPVTVDSETYLVPRGVPVLLPVQHVNALSDCVITRYAQTDVMQQLVPRYKRMYPFRVIQWPKNYGGGEVEKEIIRHEVIDVDQD